MSMKAPGCLACALTSVFMCGAAGAAGNYNGNWPITITNSQPYDGTYCLTLSTGGGASLNGPLGNMDGNFEVLDRNLVASIAQQDGGGLNDGLMFILPAANGKLAKGTFVEDGDGYLEYPGAAKVGTKGGC